MRAPTQHAVQLADAPRGGLRQLLQRVHVLKVVRIVRLALRMQKEQRIR